MREEGSNDLLFVYSQENEGGRFGVPQSDNEIMWSFIRLVKQL